MVTQINCPVLDQIKTNDHNVKAKHVRIFIAVVQTLSPCLLWHKKRNLDQISGILTSVFFLPTFFATFLLPKKMKGTKNLSSLTVYSQNASVAFSNFCVRLPAIKLEIPRYRFIKICLIFLALMSSFFLTYLEIHTLICTMYLGSKVQTIQKRVCIKYALGSFSIFINL